MKHCIFTAALLVLLPTATFAQPLTAEAKTKTLETLQQAIARRAFVPGVDFSKLPTALEKRRPELDKAEDMRAFSNTVNLALRDFGISHIRLMTPASAQQRRTGQAIGFGLAMLPSAEGLTVSTLAPGSHAAGIGLSVGDVILEVEGQPVTNPTSVDQDGRETSLLTVKRKADGVQKHVMLLRKPYSIVRKPTLTWPAPGVARFTLPSFTAGYNQLEVEALFAQAAKAKALIVDLRSNGGGLVNNSAHLLSLLLPPGTPTGSSVTREMAAEYKEKTGKEGTDPIEVAKWKGPTRKTTARKIAPYKGKVIVLINRGSASASEIVSSVLREERGSKLVGLPSAGAVLTSIFFPLPTGFEVQLPLSDYITPRGVRLEKNPIKPDVEVASATPTKEEATDPCVIAALKALK
ncbi:S41 family peptidase [Armatimonas sp.]|uniref:S41 family peptidase n=1 Tax=Armatimonas sp. TaxID=1872638 RepID=UPI00374D76D6